MSEYQNIPNEEENEKAIDLRELMTVLISRAVWIALAVAVCLTAAFCYTKITTKPQYRLNVTLRFVRGTMNVASDVAMATYMAEDFATMATERPVLEQVIENLSLEMSYSALLSKVKVDYTKESRILRISVTDGYPKRAQAILDEVCNVTKNLMIDEEATSYRVEGVSMPAERVASPMARNLLVAALIGFVGSAGVFILIYVLDDKLKTPDHIQRALGISTLGTIPYQRQREEVKEEPANG